MVHTHSLDKTSGPCIRLASDIFHLVAAVVIHSNTLGVFNCDCIEDFTGT